MKTPRKKDYIQRAHTNPFTDANIVLPREPSHIDWSKYYKNSNAPDFLDLGCGYGKFLFFLAQKYKDKNVLGMEIRHKVADYVNERIKAEQHNAEKSDADGKQDDENTKRQCKNNAHSYDNITVIHTNGLLFLPNFFDKATLAKIFVLFPDPHFKKKKQKARIICKQMLDIYSYVLQTSGRLYVSTDVKTYYDSMIECLDLHTDFVRVTDDELEPEIMRQSDEALRAGVKTGEVYGAVYEKIE